MLSVIWTAERVAQAQADYATGREECSATGDVLTMIVEIASRTLPQPETALRTVAAGEKLVISAFDVKFEPTERREFAPRSRRLIRKPRRPVSSGAQNGCYFGVATGGSAFQMLASICHLPFTCLHTFTYLPRSTTPLPYSIEYVPSSITDSAFPLKCVVSSRHPLMPPFRKSTVSA